MWAFWFVYIVSVIACAFILPERLSIYFKASADATEGMPVAVQGIVNIIADFSGL